ncbi:MAG: Fic family protein [Acidobacteriota bacterium]|nr:Fic family protein [Acidobacteriota bacterium]
MLFDIDKLDLEEIEVLSMIEQLRKELGFAVAPRRWSGFLRRNTFARAIRGSNSIEGYNVTIDDAMAAVEGEEPLDPKTEAWAAVNGYRMAMTLVLQKSDDPHFEYSAGFLNSLHFMMVGHELAKNPGRWRSGPIFVRDNSTDETVYEGPEPDLVPKLMQELIRRANEDQITEPMIKAAMGHLNLVMIHPYSDGNGRMARAFQTLILARSVGTLSPIFVSIEEYLGRNTREYYKVLAEVGGGRWQPSRNVKPWIRFCLKAHYRQAATLKQRAQRLQYLFDEIERLCKKRGLPERSIAPLGEAASGLRIRNSTYRRLADISDVTATRDLRTLVETGVLEARGKKRGRYYVAAQPLLEIAKKVGGHLKVGDPFKMLRTN